MPGEPIALKTVTPPLSVERRSAKDSTRTDGKLTVAKHEMELRRVSTAKGFPIIVVVSPPRARLTVTEAGSKGAGEDVAVGVTVVLTLALQLGDHVDVREPLAETLALGVVLALLEGLPVEMRLRLGVIV